MQEQIKELRVNIDGLYQLVKELKPCKEKLVGHNPDTFEIAPKVKFSKISSKEIEDAAHSLIYAKAWLGKVLGELGTENPYGSGYKTVEDIKPTADTHMKINEIHVMGKEQGLIPEDYLLFTHIEKVDWLRSSIEDLIQQVIKLDLKGSRELAIARTNCYNYLCESKMALGFEFQRIKLENK